MTTREDGPIERIERYLDEVERGGFQGTPPSFDDLQALVALSSERDGLRERVEAVRRVIEDGFERNVPKGEKCEHGRFGWEDCIGCYDEALLAALTGVTGG